MAAANVVPVVVPAALNRFVERYEGAAFNTLAELPDDSSSPLTRFIERFSGSFVALAEHEEAQHRLLQKLTKRHLKGTHGTRALWRLQHPQKWRKRGGRHVQWHSRWRYDPRSKK